MSRGPVCLLEFAEGLAGVDGEPLQTRQGLAVPDKAHGKGPRQYSGSAGPGTLEMQTLKLADNGLGSPDIAAPIWSAPGLSRAAL